MTAVFLAALLKWNKISAAVGVFITNPVTAPFFYGITWIVGSALVPHDSDFQLPSEFSIRAATMTLKHSPEIIWILTLGGIITGLPIAVIGYYLSRWCIFKYRDRHGIAEN